VRIKRQAAKAENTDVTATATRPFDAPGESPPANGDDPELAPVTPRKGKPERSFWAELPLLIGIALLIAFLVKTFVAQAYYIPSESMVPQLKVGDRVVVSKLSYRLHKPRRGDIIVFDAPPGATGLKTESKGKGVPRVARNVLEAVGLRQPSTEEFIKRVIGLPGDTVEGRNGKVYVNGLELVEPYLHGNVTTSDFGPVKVPKGRLWLMGDNRDNSEDSRVFGTVPESTVVGRAVVRPWPLNRLAFL
jgi:signal peptidase I